ncbi:MAG: ubiquinol-cytochrome c reductase [Phycisphaerales bacterium]|nr:MAG: ubiquinol-cytochrome c reductase [Phycisphaerales bacterium]
MATWLLKTEPSDYAWDDMVADRRTAWTGVANNAARVHMRQVRKGDQAFFYHTGNQKAIVGLVKIVTDPYEDPDEPGLTADGQVKAPLFDVQVVRAAQRPLTLAEMKADRRFEGFDLLRLPRLSVMPVPARYEAIIRERTGL